MQLWLLFTLFPQHVPSDGVLVDSAQKGRSVKSFLKLAKTVLGDVQAAKQLVLTEVGPTSVSGLALASLVVPRKDLTFHAIARALCKNPLFVPLHIRDPPSEGVPPPHPPSDGIPPPPPHYLYLVETRQGGLHGHRLGPRVRAFGGRLRAAVVSSGAPPVPSQ